MFLRLAIELAYIKCPNQNSNLYISTPSCCVNIGQLQSGKLNWLSVLVVNVVVLLLLSQAKSTAFKLALAAPRSSRTPTTTRAVIKLKIYIDTRTS